jgi:hypothetical protein
MANGEPAATIDECLKLAMLQNSPTEAKWAWGAPSARIDDDARRSDRVDGLLAPGLAPLI